MEEFEKQLKKAISKDIIIPQSFEKAILQFSEVNNKVINRNKIVKIATILIIFLLLGNIGIIANFYYQRTELGFVSRSLETSVQNGYIENVGMNYQYSNGVGIKINYLIMSDYNLNFLIDCKSNKNVSKETLDIKDMIIYDEQNNILFCYHYKTYKQFCQAKNISYAKDMIEQSTNGYGVQLIEKTGDTIKTLYTLRSQTKFPKSKKLYIEFHEIGELRSNNNIKGNWKIELEVPEKFYHRTNIEYQCINETELSEISNVILEVSDTVANVKLTLKDANNKQIQMYLEDEKKQKYEVNKTEDSISVNNNIVNATFSLNKEDLPNLLTMKLMIGTKQYSLKLKKAEK